jgi:hypothetical protein
MKSFLKRHLLTIIFAAIGAIAGFLYWKFIECASGTCPIKSVWYLSTLYGMLLGGLIGNLAEDLMIRFRKRKD